MFQTGDQLAKYLYTFQFNQKQLNAYLKEVKMDEEIKEETQGELDAADMDDIEEAMSDLDSMQD